MKPSFFFLAVLAVLPVPLLCHAGDSTAWVWGSDGSSSTIMGDGTRGWVWNSDGSSSSYMRVGNIWFWNSDYTRIRQPSGVGPRIDYNDPVLQTKANMLAAQRQAEYQAWLRQQQIDAANARQQAILDAQQAQEKARLEAQRAQEKAQREEENKAKRAAARERAKTMPDRQYSSLQQYRNLLKNAEVLEQKGDLQGALVVLRRTAKAYPDMESVAKNIEKIIARIEEEKGTQEASTEEEKPEEKGITDTRKEDAAAVNQSPQPATEPQSK